MRQILGLFLLFALNGSAQAQECFRHFQSGQQVAETCFSPRLPLEIGEQVMVTHKGLKTVSFKATLTSVGEDHWEGNNLCKALYKVTFYELKSSSNVHLGWQPTRECANAVVWNVNFF